MSQPTRLLSLLQLLFFAIASAPAFAQQSPPTPATARTALLQAVAAFQKQASFRGGYVYEVSLDGRQRRGEGTASPTEIWVQPPGTPTVGEAFLDAWDA
ncbi:MAG: hypothetical protein RL215_179, partial [Planctomycetota bacterium]